MEAELFKIIREQTLDNNSLYSEFENKGKFSKNISMALNTKFRNFWNVYIVQKSEASIDANAVVFGYAFNNHWIWYPDSTSNLTFVIWKDYNCQIQDTYYE